MKRFSKFFALGLAAVMTFGMTVSAAPSPGQIAAAEEEAKKDAEAVLPEETVVVVDGEEVTVKTEVTALDGEEYLAAKETVSEEADSIQETLAKAGVKVAEGTAPQFVAAVDIKIPGLSADAKDITITLTVPGGVKSNLEYVVIHAGTPLAAVKAGNNEIKVTVPHFSQFIIVSQEVEDDTEAPVDPTPEEPAEEGVPAHVQAANDAYYNNRPYNQDPSKSPQTGEAVPMVAIMALICLAGAAVCVRKASYNK